VSIEHVSIEHVPLEHGPMERSDAAGLSLQIDASASAFAALHPPAGN
jgi:hypothetical protein